MFTRNWLFLGTSDIHSIYGDLDTEEKKLKMTKEDFIRGGHCDDEDDTPYDRWVNKEFSIHALVVMPRRVSIAYGNAVFRQDQIPWLRKVVTKTLKGIASSQQASTSKHFFFRASVESFFQKRERDSSPYPKKNKRRSKSFLKREGP